MKSLDEYRPFISIIIPTYNRVDMLGNAIDSFLAQSYPTDLYEIIISDNNSSDGTRDLSNHYVDMYPGRVNYIREPRQGIQYARNTAAKSARGELFYFTDDDVIADKDMLSEIVKIFQFDPEVASATGRVLPKWLVEPPGWILEFCYNGLLSLNDPLEDFIISTEDCDVFGCHMAVRREVFFESGGFNPEIIGEEWIGDGETGLNIKIKDLGYKFGFNGSSITHHVMPAHRLTQTYLNKRLANQGNSDSYAEYKKYQYSESLLARKVLEHFLSAIRSEIYFFRNYVFGKDIWHMYRAYVDYFIQRMRYDWRLLTDEGWRDMVLKYDWLKENQNDDRIYYFTLN